MAARLTTRVGVAAAKRGTVSLPSGSIVNYTLYPPANPRAKVCPMVLFGGTAQTLNSLIGHHAPLAARGGLLQYDLRGQGRVTNLSLDNCSLQQHIQDFSEVAKGLLDKDDVPIQVNLCGFSFGGRVALAIAAELPERVNKLCITGVPADRGASGRIILRNWKACLEKGDLEGFLWQSMSDGFGDSFLNRYESRLNEWVNNAVTANRAEAIKALVCQTHTDDISSPWHTLNLAQRAAEKGLCGNRALCLVGEYDRIASPMQCMVLAEKVGWTCCTLPDAGHSVPIEKPKIWRQAVLKHFE